MNWKEFVQKAKESGVKDDDEIDYFDFEGSNFAFTFIEETGENRRVICS